MSYKKYVLAGLTAICIALPASAAYAADKKDDLTGAIQQGQTNSVSADVKNQIGSVEDEQAGEVDQNGEEGQVGENATDTEGGSSADAPGGQTGTGTGG